MLHELGLSGYFGSQFSSSSINLGIYISYTFVAVLQTRGANTKDLLNQTSFAKNRLTLTVFESTCTYSSYKIDYAEDSSILNFRFYARIFHHIINLIFLKKKKVSWDYFLNI